MCIRDRFKGIIKLYGKDPIISKKAFSRYKTLSTLRFNFYPNQNKPVEISKQDGVALGCETHVDSGVFTVLYQDKTGGLQVQNRKNKKWYDVPFNKKAWHAGVSSFGKKTNCNDFSIFLYGK